MIFHNHYIDIHYCQHNGFPNLTFPIFKYRFRKGCSSHGYFKSRKIILRLDQKLPNTPFIPTRKACPKYQATRNLQTTTLPTFHAESTIPGTAALAYCKYPRLTNCLQMSTNTSRGRLERETSEKQRTTTRARHKSGNAP